MGNFSAYLTPKPAQQAVGHQWRTGIIPHLLGKEQRSAYFTWPRLITQTQFDITEHGDQWFRRYIYQYGHLVWGIPLWHDQFQLSQTAASGATSFNVVATSQRHMNVTREVILMRKGDPLTYHASRITEYSATKITIEDAINYNYPVTDYAAPVVESRISVPSGVNTSKVASSYIDIRGEEDYGEARTTFYVPPACTAATYLGHVVADFKFNHSKTFRYGHPVDNFKHNGMNFAESYYAGSDSHINATFKADLLNREEIWDYLTLFDAMLGSYDTFWLPTWIRDFTITAAVDSADVTLTMEPNEYGDFFLGNDVINRYILFYFPDKSWTCRKITGFTGTQMTVDAVMGIDLTAAQAAKTMVSYLIFSRFENDTTILQYKAAQVAMVGFETHGLVGEAL